ncbi:hypothetical protein [Aquabacterium sp.]|uniref:hypothetical protein n=1 Tax=Aquabacterium sp. TaxID=1872578 RepID=UPI0035B2BB96
MQKTPKNTLQDVAKQERDKAFDAWQKADQRLFQCLVAALSVTGRICTDEWTTASEDLSIAPDALLDELGAIPLPDSLQVSIAAAHVMLVQALNVCVESMAASADYLAAEDTLAGHLNGVSQAGEVSH